MAARLVMIFVPDDEIDRARELALKHARRVWARVTSGDTENLLCVVQGRYVERLLADFTAQFGSVTGFNVIVLPINALVPPLRETPATYLPRAADHRPPTRLEAFFSRDQLSTEELYEDLEDNVRLTSGFIFTVLASALIAGLGMRSGQTAIVIGAMVIAPFLGPSIALAMAATVGDAKLARRSVTILGAGVIVVLATMATLGTLITIDISVPELSNRTIISAADLVLALASGAAGVHAFSRGASVSLVGVMIAVALVPPLSAAGLLFGSGHIPLGVNALLLFGANLVCINVAGIATFLVQGLPPKDWRLTGGILVTWFALLALLSVIIAARFGGVLPMG